MMIAPASLPGNRNSYTIEKLSDASEHIHFDEAARLLGSLDGWEDPSGQLRDYLLKFHMKAACITGNGSLLGAVMWDRVGESDFVRLEDVAVQPEAREKGIGTESVCVTKRV
ncbi:hypothetical protein CR205_01750 [Alteribacter lacisalsi]|uniref:N-acetyltransferase domain-containing protein n=2 Tax=Alteribacter lacisalsi TaxID=2045244 RepID=A0A2W0H659_9BACI|nr:hypothetical protein CR205_01750 [Alteribacter lacisalsi]